MGKKVKANTLTFYKQKVKGGPQASNFTQMVRGDHRHKILRFFTPNHKAIALRSCDTNHKAIALRSCDTKW